jgi:periodic tryptophan protein 1
MWDLNTSKCVQSYTHHSDKVQSVAWHPTEATVFITGSYDKTVCVLDARSPGQVTRWQLDSDVESIRWDPHSPSHFYVALESGFVHYYDVRNGGSKPLYMVQAHDGPVSAMDVNPLVPGCIATGGTDKSIKVWNTVDNKPSMVTKRNFDLGKVFCTQFCPDSAFQLAIAGSNGKMHIWDMSTNAGVRQAFRHLKVLAGPAPQIEKAPITILDNADHESDDDDMDEGAGSGNSDDDEDMDEED